MAEKKLSNELSDGLAMFLFKYIKSKAKQGITYDFSLNDDSNDEKMKLAKKIKAEAERCGYGKEEVFRIFKMPNGYIFDMDLSLVKYFTIKATQIVEKEVSGKVSTGVDLIQNSPEKKRREDMKRLAKDCAKAAENSKGTTKMEIALYSRNKVPKIIVSAKANNIKNDDVVLTYNAYIIRHTDIAELNSILIPNYGIKVTNLETCEILPTKTGVRCILYIDKVKK